MNVQDVKVPFKPKDVGEEAKIIWARQNELEDTYWKIEKREAKVVNLDSRYGQILIKDFLWRITEEVGESLEAFFDFEGEPEKKLDKVREEIIDGLHFLVGLCILTNAEYWWTRGYTETDERSGEKSYKNAVVGVIYGLGLVGNTLKLKPWKQTEVLTDGAVFYRNLYKLVKEYMNLCESVGMNRELTFDYYYRKSEVNLFRIRSKY